MSIVVEHDKRRREILERALDVFIDEGYEDATFQKIADRCAITRTTLYIYFKNKKEIFNWSIKQMMELVEEDLHSIKDNESMTTEEKLKKVLGIIIHRLEEHRKLLVVVLNYLMHISKSGTNPDSRVRRRTVRLRHILAGIVIDGIRKGDLPPMNVRLADDLLYNFIESAIYRLVVLRRESVGDIIHAMEFAVHTLACKDSRTGSTKD